MFFVAADADLWVLAGFHISSSLICAQPGLSLARTKRNPTEPMKRTDQWKDTEVKSESRYQSVTDGSKQTVVNAQGSLRLEVHIPTSTDVIVDKS
ncbi:unnamed protein product [Pieris macdunnoughi]|uniref:Uncharacterized protein n=1 Tax=Pieris macdunnoughi TaxID=345717 RepID=A0A821SZG9_9NEOP|nr:unnamed protein product [Pieris macdunnoughi]